MDIVIWKSINSDNFFCIFHLVHTSTAHQCFNAANVLTGYQYLAMSHHASARARLNHIHLGKYAPQPKVKFIVTDPLVVRNFESENLPRHAFTHKDCISTANAIKRSLELLYSTPKNTNLEDFTKILKTVHHEIKLGVTADLKNCPNNTILNKSQFINYLTDLIIRTTYIISPY